MNEFIVYFSNGSSKKMSFPSDWSQADIIAQTGAVDVMYLCVVHL